MLFEEATYEGHFTGKATSQKNTKVTSQENATSLEMAFKLRIIHIQ